ncbi:MAG: archaetidylserine decarboxylase [Pseudomonadota bacterium]
MEFLQRAGRALFITMQYVLPQLLLTRGMRWLSSRQTPWVKNLIIRSLTQMFDINIAEADRAVPDGYASANEFFTRELRAGSRPLALAPAWVSPCDGVVSQCGDIENDTLLQAKGFRYRLAELLGDDDVAASYRGGQFVTIYLAPSDYHRVHTPVTGLITTHRHIPGQLFSVNNATAAAVPRLFSRNERRVFCFGSAGSEAALVMVGALNVGSISTPWGADSEAGALHSVTSLPLPPERLTRGDTLGWFNLGSTVILVLPPSVRLEADVKSGAVMRTGQAIAQPVTE